MALPLRNSQYLEHARRYEAAYQQFRVFRNLCTRKTYDDREFALVNTLTSRLLEKPGNEYNSHLQCLLVHSALSCGTKPPELSLKQLEKYIRIFYILVDLGCPQLIPLFSAKGLTDSKLPLNLASVQEVEVGDDVIIGADFHSQFLEKQYFWCPMTFDFDEGQDRGNQIIPICFRERIDTQRSLNVLSHSGAILWKIEVPEECVAPRIREKIEGARVERYINAGEGSDNHVKACHYQLALKQFFKDDSAKFSKEKATANSLKTVDGIVQYFTWYQEGEEENDRSQVSLNLVFELGEMDLYNAIRTRAPPVLPGEIKGVWESMLGISCVLSSIHQLEIENTQFNVCHGDIKPENIIFVNDRFKLGDSGEARIEVHTASDSPVTGLGGTKTYASPEKNKPIVGSNQGLTRRGRAEKEDIWSLGCVFSVVATWVILGADGVTQYGKVRQKARRRRLNTASDSFHNDYQVLPEVKAWHRYLREAARRTDTISSRVLDLVDNYMLVGPDMRDSAYIIKGLTEHLSPGSASDHGFPEEIKDLLLEIEEEEIAHERQGSLSEEPPYAVHIPSNGMAVGPLGYADSDSASARELLSRRTMPTVQRLPQRNLRPSMSDDVSLRSGIWDPDYEPSITPNAAVPYNSPYSGEYKVPSEYEDPISIFTLGQEIDKLQGGILSQLLRRTKSIKQQKQAANNDELKNFFENRDIIFLVDNAPSMAPHWMQVNFWADILLRRLLDYDDDGIEMYFSHGDRKIQVRQKKRQKAAYFTKAMRSATPDPKSDPLKCSLPLALKRIFLESIGTDQSKTKTIFILTDGIWEGCNDTGVETVIKSHMQEMGWNNPGMIDRVLMQMPLSIQFIQFGQDPKGSERLRHLDDDLARDGYPDLIDTEPAAGDAIKMLLGSLDKNIDQRLSTMNRASFSIAPTSPISPQIDPLRPHSLSH